MSDTATYEQGHLLVAGIRILEHQHKHPPTEEDLAQLLGISREWTGVLVRALAEAGVVRVLESAFTVRVEVLDHLGLEKLPKESEAKHFGTELEEFRRKRAKEEESLGEMFGSDFRKKQEEEMDAMADKLKSFKHKKPKPNPLFDDTDD